MSDYSSVISQQREKEAQILGLTERLLPKAKEIGQELDEHNRLLDKVHFKTQNTLETIENPNFLMKMRKLIDKVHTRYYMGIIIALSVLLVLIIFFVNPEKEESAADSDGAGQEDAADISTSISPHTNET